MNILIPILFIVAMIYSEVNKKKKEDADMDLNDLMSFDDFVSKSPPPPSNMPSYTPPSRAKKIKPSNTRQKTSSPPKLNIPPCPVENTNRNNRGKASVEMEWGDAKKKASSKKKKSLSMKLTKEELLKTFIFSEVLNRYDINRIYERIPGVNRDDQ